MCDDLDTTMDELAAKGATLTAVTGARWGRLTSLHLPGGARWGCTSPDIHGLPTCNIPPLDKRSRRPA
jgi:hypothetical protein